MMLKPMMGTIALFFLGLCNFIYAEELKLDDITISSMKWGRQTARVKLVNLSYDYKFIAVKSDVSYTNSPLNSRRTFKKIFIIEPIYSAVLDFPIEIPGNFGTLNIKFSLYDIVDTLDQLYNSQIFAVKEITGEIPLPEGMAPYSEKLPIVPQFAESNSLFDNQFTRYLLFFVAQGKNSSEIARLMNAEPGYVDLTIDRLVAAKYLNRSGEEIFINSMIIDEKMSEALRPALDKAIDNLYQTIKNGLPSYQATLQTLASQGQLTRDIHNIMDAGSVLYHYHPALLGLLLWQRLGHYFINDGARFNIFENSDPCRAEMGEYFYLAAATGNPVPRSFYYNISDEEGERFYTSMEKISLICQLPETPENDSAGEYFWGFPEVSFPILYTYDSRSDSILYAIFGSQCRKLAEPLRRAIDDRLSGGKNKRGIKGARYYFWNLVVTGVMTRLEKENIVAREGNGVYNFQRLGEE
jgi:hypothetical protein